MGVAPSSSWLSEWSALALTELLTEESLKLELNWKNLELTTHGPRVSAPTTTTREASSSWSPPAGPPRTDIHDRSTDNEGTSSWGSRWDWREGRRKTEDGQGKAGTHARRREEGGDADGDGLSGA
jgi:hypothetical protein